MHNNRCGDIDPYIIFYLVESCGMTLEEVKQMLQTRSGLYGMSGGAGCDLRDVQAAAEAGNEDAELAIRAYCYSIKNTSAHTPQSWAGWTRSSSAAASA